MKCMQLPNTNRILGFVFAVGLFLSFSTPASGQSTGVISGTVTDPSGAAIVQAKVVVRNPAKGQEWSITTDARGNYQVVSLPFGQYQVEVQAQGFQTKVSNDVTVEVAKVSTLNIKLEVGEVSQSITVSAETPPIEASTQSVGTVIGQRTVQEIPLNGRHFVDLGLLLPGSVVQPQNGFLTGPVRGQGAFAFNTAGHREDTTNFMINGINLNDMVQNQITFQPSINTIAEFKVDNSTFSAEYGRNSGAIANIGTRSGTNQIHGEGFEFLRNDQLDAKNFFDNPALRIPKFQRNQFGTAVGGPLWLGRLYDGRDRTFWFFSYEGLRQRQNVTFNTLVPTPAQRALVTDPTSQKLLLLIPLANVPGTIDRFAGSGGAPVNLDQWTFDLSHRLTSRDTIHGYYAIQTDLRQEPNLQGNNIPGFGDQRQARRQIFTFNETHIFSPRVVNEFRFGLNRIHITFDTKAKLNPLDFGINDGITAPMGLPQINIRGLVNFGGPAAFPQGRADTVFVWSDTLSYLVGKHSLKFGGEVRRFQNNNFSEGVGSAVFNSFSNFAKGRVDTFSITLGGVIGGVRTAAVGLFAQDNYKFRQNLTFELGLRWDLNETPNEVQNRFVAFDQRTGKLRRVGADGFNQIYRDNNKDFGPRVGFAWDPFKTGKTSVRGGYGLYFDQPVTNSVTGLTANPPLAIPLTAVSTAGSPVSISNPLAAAKGSPTSSPATIDPDFRNDYVQEWNFGIEREVMKDLAVQIRYVGSKGTHLRQSRNINQRVNGVRPFPTFSNITEVGSPGTSTYNALWVSATKRLSKGLQFLASYTWSHSIDLNSLNSQGITSQDSNNVRNERGSSDFDARHHFNISYIYDLPFKGNRLVEGWEVSGITTFQSGNPVNITVTGAGATGLATRRANLAGNPALANPDPALFFNPAAFCAPGTAGCAGPAVFGNLGRNVITGPDFNNFDFSIMKTTRVNEYFKIQFRTEIFDIFNHPNFGQPGRVVGTQNFGVIQDTRFGTGDAGSSRQIQFAIKILF